MPVLEWKERAFIGKWTPDVFVDFRLAYWCTKTVHQYGVSIQSSTKVRETFWQITLKLWATKTWDLDNLFIYYSFITLHFLSFFHWTVSNLIFCCLTVKMIYILVWNQARVRWSHLLHGSFSFHPDGIIFSLTLKLRQNKAFFLDRKSINKCHPVKNPTLSKPDTHPLPHLAIHFIWPKYCEKGG